MNREQVQDWVRGYERAWRSPGTELLRELFTEDATYRHYREPDRSEEFRDIWLLRFEDGRCAQFEEWAFWPAKPYTGPPS